jgi:hypothetical protein
MRVGPLVAAEFAAFASAEKLHTIRTPAGLHESFQSKRF